MKRISNNEAVKCNGGRVIQIVGSKTPEFISIYWHFLDKFRRLDRLPYGTRKVKRV